MSVFSSRNVRWRIRHAMTFFFAAPLEALRPHARPGAALYELEPGVGSFELGYVSFEAGNQGFPAFQELSLAVRLANPHSLPRFLEVFGKMAFETRHIGAESEPFLEHAEARDRLPVYRSPLSFDTTTSAAGLPRVSVSDSNGEIGTFERTARARWYLPWIVPASVIAAPLDGSDSYYATTFWYRGPLRFTEKPQAVRLHSGHPFFRGMDVSEARSLGVFFSPPRTRWGTQIFTPPAQLS
jgi:hypothetical protein